MQELLAEEQKTFHNFQKSLKLKEELCEPQISHSLVAGRG
jgi:hypothetical protein